MIRTIHLHGEMGDRFGRSFELDVGSVAETFRALGAQIPGFHRYVLEHQFGIVRGKTVDGGFQFDERSLAMGLGSSDLHVVPIIAGSGGNARNIGKIVAGTAIAALAWWAAPAAGMGAALFGPVTYGNVAGVGLMIALTGASGMLSKTTEPTKDQSSAVYSGAYNADQAGGAIPKGWGKFRVGSTIGSRSVSSVEIPIDE